MTAPDLARILGVPNVYTRYDLAALDEFNAGVERARRAYDADPFAASRGTDTCSRCRNGQHGQCTSQAHRRGIGGLVMCACWPNHPPRTKETR